MTGVEVDQLLEEEVVERLDARQVVRRGPQIEGRRRLAQPTQIKVALPGRSIDQWIEPEVQARREGLAHRGEGVLGCGAEVRQRVDASRRDRLIAGRAIGDDVGEARPWVAY